MAIYNWQQADWPNFSHNLESLGNELFSFAEMTGRITGSWLTLSESAQQDTVIDRMVAEAVKTSQIEGERINREDVFSSIRRNLGLHDDNRRIKDRRAAGVADLMLDIRKTWQAPLTAKSLFLWHTMLLGGSHGIQIGSWRTHVEPMQIVSGAIGREKVHFEAPPSSQVPDEMKRFMAWFNHDSIIIGNPLQQAPIRSAIAHLYFESIHPFEDGNGRIGRAIAEKALSQGIGRPVLFSLSEAIEANKKAYYETLKQAQRSNHVTEWIRYFIRIILQAQTNTEAKIDFTLRKARFFDRFREVLNDRQQAAIRSHLEAGIEGLDRGLSAGTYAEHTATSKATATRDLQSLLELGAVTRLGEASGRSTKYRVNL